MWTRLVYTPFNCLGDICLPPHCVLCGRAGQRPNLDLCADCAADLPRVPRPCPRCGLPVPPGSKAAAAGADCALCRRAALPYASCVAPWLYEFPLSHLVRALKYQGALTHARVLGGLLAGEVERVHPGQEAVLVPVPLHHRRLQQRGFNQSHEIARIVARRLHWPLLARALRRTRDTASQVGLSRAQREQNLLGAFAVESALVEGRRVVLLDDVLTTGSTAHAAASALQAAGAARVDLVAVARAPG
jgi:ComF family protein